MSCAICETVNSAGSTANLEHSAPLSPHMVMTTFSTPFAWQAFIASRIVAMLNVLCGAKPAHVQSPPANHEPLLIALWASIFLS